MPEKMPEAADSPETVPQNVLTKRILYALQRGISIFRTYRTRSVRRDVTRSDSRKWGLTGYPVLRHLVQVSRLTAPVPQGLSVQNADSRRIRLPRDPFKYEGRDLTDAQFRAALAQSARRDLDLFVYGKGAL